jgi:hypothetical protein
MLEGIILISIITVVMTSFHLWKEKIDDELSELEIDIMLSRNSRKSDR